MTAAEAFTDGWSVDEDGGVVHVPSHGNDVSWLGHLVVHLLERSRSALLCNVGLSTDLNANFKPAGIYTALLFSALPSCRQKRLWQPWWVYSGRKNPFLSNHDSPGQMSIIWTEPELVWGSRHIYSYAVHSASPPPPSYLPQRWGHFIGQRSCDNHDIGLSGTRSEHHAETIHVVTGRCHVHHLHCAAGQAEGHGPQRALRGKRSSSASDAKRQHETTAGEGW